MSDAGRGSCQTFVNAAVRYEPMKDTQSPPWVPGGSLAGNFWVGVRLIFGQTCPQNLSRSTGLVLQYRLHQDQPCRPILSPFHGTTKVRPDFLRVPSLQCSHKGLQET